MVKVDSLRYYAALLGGVMVTAAIFFMVQGFVTRHQFQSIGARTSEAGINLENNNFVPTVTAVDNLAAPRGSPKLETPPLPENSTDFAASSPPVIPRPVMPLPQIEVPFNTIGGAPPVESNGSATAPAGASAVGATALTAGDLVLVRRVDPKYPTQAALQGIQGSVTLSFTVEPDGSVSGPVVTGAKPRRGIFDDAALRAVVRWKFKPIHAPTTTSVTLVFNLGKGG